MKSSALFHTQKAKFIMWLFVLGFFGVLVFLARWQIFDSERFLVIASERYRDKRIPSVRGSILATDGTTLAYSEPRFDIYVWIKDLEDYEQKGLQTRAEFVQKVSTALSLVPSELEATLSSGQLWIKIADKATVDQRDALLELRQDRNSERYLQGFQIEYTNKRIYPENKLASHTIGFVGSSTYGRPVGIGGIEQYYDGSLKPIEGFETGEFDTFGNPIIINTEEQLAAKPGVTIYTTLDKVLQAKLEYRLKVGFEQYSAKSVTGIIMDPKTGAVLAMATYPDFDPNFYYKEENGEVFGNKAITVPYEIGSIGKVFTISAALDSNKLEPDSVILPNGHRGCEIISPDPPPGAACFDPKFNKVECICTYNREPYTKPITTAEALVNSDNIGFRHIALSMENQIFYKYLEDFGVGAPTNIDLSGESIGLLKDYNQWNYADQAVYSYGHSYQITPIQAITGVASLANDGKRMQPYTVKKVVDADNQTTEFHPRILKQVVTPETADTVSRIMHEVFKTTLIEERYKYLSKYFISLKSGTALIPHKDRAGYSNKINATYVGFDASPEHKFIMLIKIEEPNVGDLSFFNARLLWLDTFIDIKDHLGVPEYAQ